jgi:hypothetical protein
MKNALIIGMIALTCAGCDTRIAGFRKSELRTWFVPEGMMVNREPTPYPNVAYFSSPPTNAPFRVIGYIMPPSGEFRSWSQLLNAVRGSASLYGADAVFVDDQRDLNGWGFNASRAYASGGSKQSVQIRAVAITFKDQH